MGDLTKESYIHDIYTTAKSVKKGEQLSISIDVDAIVMGLGLIITGLSLFFAYVEYLVIENSHPATKLTP